MDIINWFLTAVFGRAHYRVRLTYKDDGGMEMFCIHCTVHLQHPRYIMKPRHIMLVYGNLWENDELRPLRHRLCNGRIEMEPVCYLGRWRDE